MHHLDSAGRGWVHSIIFVHEFEADLRGWKLQGRCSARAYRCTKKDLGIHPKAPDVLGRQFRGLLSAVAPASEPHGDPQNGLTSGPEKPRTAQWCFGGGRA